MTILDRRHLIGGLLAGGGALAAQAAHAAPDPLNLDDLTQEATLSCLYHCDFSDDRRYDAMLSNINNHLLAYDFDPFEIKIVIVAHGGGVKYHLSDLLGTPWESSPPVDPDLLQRMRGLAGYGVEVYLCQLTFERFEIDLSKARGESYLKLVRSGVAAIGQLQGKGYAYLKVG